MIYFFISNIICRFASVINQNYIIMKNQVISVAQLVSSSISNFLGSEFITISRNEFKRLLETNTDDISSLLISLIYYNKHNGSRMINGKSAVEKLSYACTYIGHDYANKVNERLLAQAKKQAQETGEKVEDIFNKFVAQNARGLVRKNNVLYYNAKNLSLLRIRAYVKHEKNGNVENATIEKSLGLFHNDELKTFEECKSLDLFTPSYFTPKKSKGRGQLTKGENDFQIRTYNLENIQAIKFRGNVYKLVD